MVRRILMFAIVWLCIAASVDAQVNNRVAFDLTEDYPFPSIINDLMQETLNTDYAKPCHSATSLHLKYSFSFSPSSSQGRICPEAWQGLGASVSFFGNPKGLGNPVSIYLLQGAPFWKVNKKVDFFYEWNFGISMGWKPCDGFVAHSNLIVGSRCNAYINIGGGVRWWVADNWALTAGLEITHFSNGNTSSPNPGVNLAGIRVGVSHQFGKGRTEPSSSLPADTTWRQKRFGVDVTAYGAWRKRIYRGGDEPVLLPGHFGVAGMHINPLWNVTRNFRVGGSLDIQWDESTDLKKNYIEGTTTSDIRFNRPGFLRQTCFGLSARAELVMPLFSVNVGMGYNIIAPEESRATYQMVNLKLRLYKGLYANVGYQLLDFKRMGNLMLGAGWSFR